MLVLLRVIVGRPGAGHRNTTLIVVVLLLVFVAAVVVVVFADGETSIKLIGGLLKESIRGAHLAAIAATADDVCDGGTIEIADSVGAEGEKELQRGGRRREACIAVAVANEIGGSDVLFALVAVGAIAGELAAVIVGVVGGGERVAAGGKLVL